MIFLRKIREKIRKCRNKRLVCLNMNEKNCNTLDDAYLFQVFDSRYLSRGNIGITPYDVKIMYFVSLLNIEILAVLNFQVLNSLCDLFYVI